MNIVRCLQQLFSKKPAGTRFTGDFKSWDEAKRCSTGYDTPEILEKTRAALLKVRAGKAAFERDSMAFDQMEYDFPLLAGLLRAAAQDDGRLSVLDFGGSLGGTYFQCRTYLSSLRHVRWSVVEQPAHVACGRTDFANKELHFYETIADCLSEQKPNVLLLSGVLQYLREPYLFLETVLRERIPYVIVERTSFDCNQRDRLTVQYVPAWIYKASYPIWFLSETSFQKVFAPHYRLICEYVAEREPARKGTVIFKGFQFEARLPDSSENGGRAAELSDRGRRQSGYDLVT
jgi:putative methyltransferase (TIGR04325 family)